MTLTPPPYDTSNYVVDQTLDLIQVHATNFGHGPHLSYNQWHALPEDAKKIWDSLSQDAKTIILRPPPKPDPNQRLAAFQRNLNAPPPRRPPIPRRNMNEHDLDYLIACLHELHGGGCTNICLRC